MLRIVIGTAPNQHLAQRVLEYSIRKSASREVDIRCVRQNRTSAGGTKFGYARFRVPHLCDFQGRAIYLDADQVVLGDVHELAELLHEPHAVGIVQSLEGTFAGKPVGPRNETSVMVLDCAKLTSWDPLTMFDPVVENGVELGPGQIHYRSFMRIAWVDPSLVQAIDPRWNHYNMVRDDSKLVHFSHVREQPWKKPNHPCASFWESWLSDAIAAGYVTRRDVFRAVARGYAHRHFLRHLF